MNKNIITGAIVGIIVVGGGSFYGGMKYAQSSGSSYMRGAGQFQGGINGGIRGPRTGMMGGFVTGEVLSKDDKSLTVKMRDGSSKIVFFATSTQFVKSASSSVSDVVAGAQVMVTGTSNSDGSVSAQSVQIR